MLDPKNHSLHEFQGDCYRGIQAYELALNCYSKYSQHLMVENLRVLEKKG